MGKTLVLTEKKSVAEDFARVLKGFHKEELSFERPDLVIAWASGHLLELKSPDAYDEKWKRWSLADLPILPRKFEHEPRRGEKRSAALLKHLVHQMKRKDITEVVNACDAGREGELIFNLILDHAQVRGKKPILRFWLQSMTTRAIEEAFAELREVLSGLDHHFTQARRGKGGIVFQAEEVARLADAAYARDEADWLVGMNGTRALTRKFMGKARQFFAVGRVKTPTLAFLVDRERDIDAFVPVPYYQLDATFVFPGGQYVGRWYGTAEDGKKSDRLATREAALAIQDKAAGRSGRAEDRETRKNEIPPLLYDLTTLQREASQRFGYTLDRTLAIAQSLYENRKAITYPRTSSRFLPSDYAGEISNLVLALQRGPLAQAAALVPPDAQPEIRPRVFNDAKVSDHFALIPTGENPHNMRDDEMRIYEMIVRRFLAAFLPSAEWLNITRETLVEGEMFQTKGRRLVRGREGWRAVEPASEDEPLPALPADGIVSAESVELLAKETQPPARYTDGTLVKAMESAGQDVEHGDDLDEETIEEIKEKGIGTPATRAAIVNDLIEKGLARRERRTILPTPLGCTLVRLVRNLSLDALAKPDLTGEWEYRLAQIIQGGFSREQFKQAMKRLVQEIVDAVRLHEGGNEMIFARDHGGPLIFKPRGEALMEKTFSYLSADSSINISKDQKGKYLFPETLRRLLDKGEVGPLTGFQGTRAPGFLRLSPDGEITVEMAPASGEDEAQGLDTQAAGPQRESVPDGLVVGVCPKCGGPVERQGTGYRCLKNIPRAKDKECDFRLAEKIKYRYLPLEQIKKLLAGPGGKTDFLFGFISMNGKKFQASLSYSEKGDLQWEFPPRAPRKTAAAKGPKKTGAAEKGRARGGRAPAPQTQEEPVG